MSIELTKKQIIMQSINLKKYFKPNYAEQKKMIFNDNCSDEMEINYTIEKSEFKINYLNSNSCSIAEFGASILLDAINDQPLDKVLEYLKQYKETIMNDQDSEFKTKFDFLSELRKRESCLLMLANFLERELDEKNSKK